MRANMRANICVGMCTVSAIDHQVVPSPILPLRLKMTADIYGLDARGNLFGFRTAAGVLLRIIHYQNACIVMAERDEFQDQTLNGHLPWRERSPEEHGQAIASLMRYVSAAPRHRKKDKLDFPVIKDLLQRLSDKEDQKY